MCTQYGDKHHQRIDDFTQNKVIFISLFSDLSMYNPEKSCQCLPLRFWQIATLEKTSQLQIQFYRQNCILRWVFPKTVSPICSIKKDFHQNILIICLFYKFIWLYPHFLLNIWPDYLELMASTAYNSLLL